MIGSSVEMGLNQFICWADANGRESRGSSNEIAQWAVLPNVHAYEPGVSTLGHAKADWGISKCEAAMVKPWIVRVICCVHLCLIPVSLEMKNVRVFLAALIDCDYEYIYIYDFV